MNEPKTYIVYTPREGVVEGLFESYSIRLDGVKVYLKSEVDRHIAELTQKLNNEIEHRKRVAVIASELKKAQIAEYNEAMHQKYKRCLDKAMRCFTKSNYHFVLARHGEDCKENNRKSILYSKWRQRWLELAEKFKKDV